MRNPRRKIIVYIATSVDGYIARPDGNVDWLNRPRIAGDYGVPAFNRSIDTILFGRKTYEMALGFQKDGVEDPGFDPKVKNYIFSRKPKKRSSPGVEFVNEPITAFAKRLRAAPGKNIWMMGGAGIIASFLDAGEIVEGWMPAMATASRTASPVRAQMSAEDCSTKSSLGRQIRISRSACPSMIPSMSNTPARTLPAPTSTPMT